MKDLESFWGSVSFSGLLKLLFSVQSGIKTTWLQTKHSEYVLDLSSDSNLTHKYMFQCTHDIYCFADDLWLNISNCHS